MQVPRAHWATREASAPACANHTPHSGSGPGPQCALLMLGPQGWVCPLLESGLPAGPTASVPSQGAFQVPWAQSQPPQGPVGQCRPATELEKQGEGKAQVARGALGRCQGRRTGTGGQGVCPFRSLSRDLPCTRAQKQLCLTHVPGGEHGSDGDSRSLASCVSSFPGSVS